MRPELTLSEKTTAMEKAIKMAKEIHPAPARFENLTFGQQPTNFQPPNVILETAKQIYDWLIS